MDWLTAGTMRGTETAGERTGQMLWGWREAMRGWGEMRGEMYECGKEGD